MNHNQKKPEDIKTSRIATCITIAILLCLFLAGGIFVLFRKSPAESASGPETKSPISESSLSGFADRAREWLGIDTILSILGIGDGYTVVKADPSIAVNTASDTAETSSPAGSIDLPDQAASTADKADKAMQDGTDASAGSSSAPADSAENKTAQKDTKEEANEKGTAKEGAAEKEAEKEVTTREKAEEKEAGEEETKKEETKEKEAKEDKTKKEETKAKEAKEDKTKKEETKAKEAKEDKTKEEETKAKEEAEEKKDKFPTKLQKKYVAAWEEWHMRDFPANYPLHNYNWKYLSRDESGSLRYEGDDHYMVRHGIDVSEFQGKIDWDKVREDGYDFVFVRVGHRTMHTGDLQRDSRAIKNLTRAKEAGFDVGAYIFSQAITKEEAREEAQLCLDVIKESGIELTLPIVFDPEIVIEDYYARINFISGEQFTDNAVAFCEKIKKAGYTPAVYANCSTETDILDMSRLKDNIIWYADYSGIPETPYDFTFWQYSNLGWVDGIPETETDLNVWFVKK